MFPCVLMLQLLLIKWLQNSYTFSSNINFRHSQTKKKKLKKSQCAFEEDTYQGASCPNRKNSAKFHVVKKTIFDCYNLSHPLNAG